MGIVSVDSKAVDPGSAVPSVSSLHGAQLVAREDVCMEELCHGSTLDETAQWTDTSANGGAVALANGAITFSPSTGSTGTAVLDSIRDFVYWPSAETVLECKVRMGTVGIASNVRAISLYVDSSNYCGFLFDGTSFYARVYTNGSSFGGADQTIATVNPSDLNGIELKIRVTKSSAHFYVNKTEVASFTEQGSQTVMHYGGSVVGVHLESTNSGSTVNNTMIFTSLSVKQLYRAWPGQVRVKQMAASGLVARGPCHFLTAYATVAADVLAFYDNTAGTGTVIGEIPAATLSGVAAPQVLLPVQCVNGLYVDQTTGSGNFYVYYTT